MLRTALGRSCLDTFPASPAVSLAPHTPRTWQVVSDDVSRQQSPQRALVRVPWQPAVANLLEGMPMLATSHCPRRAHHRGGRQEDIEHSVPNANPGLLLLLAEYGPPRTGLNTVVYTLCCPMEVCSSFSRLLHT